MSDIRTYYSKYSLQCQALLCAIESKPYTTQKRRLIMKPEFILMLTYNDQTVENALELFSACKDTPVTHWGFKDVGLSAEKMKRLVQEMKRAGKTTFLEVVSLSEKEGLAGAKIAVEAGFDILMGTVFFDSILSYLKDKPIKYYPFPGHVFSHPSILDGEIDEIVKH